MRQVGDLISDRGWEVVNVDTVVVAELTMLSPFITEMREEIGGGLGIGPDHVTIKATTTEGLGFLGEGKGIAAHAVALVERK